MFICIVVHSFFSNDCRIHKRSMHVSFVVIDTNSCFVFAISAVIVEWSAKGKFLAVAKGNNLCILSSKFKERQSILLSFRSLVGESDVNGSIKGN